MIAFEEQETQTKGVSIKVIGVGGAGGNTINSVIDSGCKDVDFIVANTDAQAIEQSQASCKVQIGVKSTKGLGTGADPEIGKRAAEEDLDKIMEVLEDGDIVFLAAGMGGGTGSGALPVIAHALREKGILSIAIVTKPFLFEGKRRAKCADQAIEQLKKHVDTLIVMPNQNLLDITDEHISMIEAFSMINNVLSQSIKSVSEIITKAGHINVDFSDVRTIMKDRGIAVLGTGCAAGEHRAQDATRQAISSPLLENMSIKGAKGILFNIAGGKDLGLHEISQAASLVYEQAHEDANIILGSVIDETLQDEVRVTIIATGFAEQEGLKEVPVGAYKVDTVLDNIIDQYKDVEDRNEHHEVVQKTYINHVAQQEKKIEDSVSHELSTRSTDKIDFSLNKQQKDKQKTYELTNMKDLDIPTFMREPKE
jgi:cell division protein FtsZ